MISNLPESGVTGIEFFDMNGRSVKKVHAEANTNQTVNVSTLPPGVYTVRLDDQRSVATLRFIKE